MPIWKVVRIDRAGGVDINSFSKDDQDIDCAKEEQLELKLKGNQPVQKKYTAIHRPLYCELEGFIEDFLIHARMKQFLSGINGTHKIVKF